MNNDTSENAIPTEGPDEIVNNRANKTVDKKLDKVVDQRENKGENSLVSSTVSLKGVDLPLLFGQYDIFLRMIEDQFEAKIFARGETVSLEGARKEVDSLKKLFDDLKLRLSQGNPLTEQYVRYTIGLIKEGGSGAARDIKPAYSSNHPANNGVEPRTVGQKEYLEAIEKYDIVISIGPAGTGKTFLAVSAAVAALKSGSIKRIILVRPAVEAGESLGFLPGDIRAKVDPYLRPIYDSLHELLPAERVRKLMETGVIEIAPLAFMRGRTLNGAFVVLDEAQNSTTAQMKMFLTRLGENSKAVVNGDVTQIDLVDPTVSGLVSAERVLKNIRGLKFIKLTDRDVVRHRLVQDILKAYENSSAPYQRDEKARE
ncbi:MAG: PhoH family protein [candidate division Zixibacteria bacterium]|nr:PhoH family protein [candidate division Zixibacteria bacterium]